MEKVRQLILIGIIIGKFKKRICKSWSLPFSVYIYPTNKFRIGIGLFYKNIEFTLGFLNIIICKLEEE